ncbi:MAG: hypothetical protein EPN48_18510 [Microbacteriaceae bacterium]|nr:MAG: hypothetical protein EPN48_18510 [Microbacteriaceae bacterium]
MTATLFDYFGQSVNLTAADAKDEPLPLRYKKARAVARPIGNGTYEPYVVQRIEIPGAHRHGTALVEAAALASVAPPMPTYRPVLEPSLITNGTLSLEQLETVTYVGQQHERRFTERVAVEVPDDETPGSLKTVTLEQSVRGGYIIADGTGVGKGRESAGIIRDNVNQGRPKHVWISISQLLREDAIRDWTDLGGRRIDVIPWDRTAITEPLHFERGVLFGTYALLRAKHTKNGTTHTRLEQLIDALGRDFDGVIIFDEAHAGANADPKTQDAEDSQRKASAQGQAMLALQHALPNARFVYVSATGASRLDALAYATRLQLWGPGTAFETRGDFLRSMHEGGTSAMEVVCRDLKAYGRLCARSLSYEGVTYERVIHELDAAQVQEWNDYAKIWRLINRNIFEELKRLGIDDASIKGAARTASEAIRNSPVGRIRSHLEATKLRFYGQVLLALKMPTLIERVECDLQKGRAIVIQLTHTNEAQLNRALDERDQDEPLDDLCTSHRDMLIDFVTAAFPVHRYRAVNDGEGLSYEVETDPVTREPVVDALALIRRSELIASIENLVFARGALEILYDTFGENRIAEISGRSKKLVWRTKADGTEERVLVPRGPKENLRETDAFLNGTKDILIFTEGAGGVGRSYHADILCKNQKPRTHILLEISWRAEGAVQGMGRTHRTGQVCPPHYILLSTNVPGERRFLSTPARRIAALGALSRGQRDSLDNGLFRAEDNLETPYAAAALRELITAIASKSIPDLSPGLFYEQTGIDANLLIERWESDNANRKRGRHSFRVSTFLARLLGCELDGDGGLQGRIMDAFVGRIEALVAKAIEEHRYDAGVNVFHAEHLQVTERSTIYRDTTTGTTAELLVLDAERRPPDLHTWNRVAAKKAYYEESTKRHDAIFMDHPDLGLALRIPVRSLSLSGEPLVRLITPAGEHHVFQRTMPTLSVIDEADAQRTWDDAVANLPLKKTRLFAIAGVLLPIWNRLPHSIQTVYRMQTDEGERLLARIIPEADLGDTLVAFNVVFSHAA